MTLRPHILRPGQPAKLAVDLAQEQQTKTIRMPCSRTHMHMHTQIHKPNRWQSRGGTKRPVRRRHERTCRPLAAVGGSQAGEPVFGHGDRRLPSTWAQTAKPLEPCLTPASPWEHHPQTQCGKRSLPEGTVSPGTAGPEPRTLKPPRPRVAPGASKEPDDPLLPGRPSELSPSCLSEPWAACSRHRRCSLLETC